MSAAVPLSVSSAIAGASGAVVSSVNVMVAGRLALPALSISLTEILLLPSVASGAVVLHVAPPSDT